MYITRFSYTLKSYIAVVAMYDWTTCRPLGDRSSCETGCTLLCSIALNLDGANVNHFWLRKNMNINTTDNTCFKSIQKVPFAFIWIYQTPVNSGKDDLFRRKKSHEKYCKLPEKYSKSPICSIRNDFQNFSHLIFLVFKKSHFRRKKVFKKSQ